MISSLILFHLTDSPLAMNKTSSISANDLSELHNTSQRSTARHTPFQCTLDSTTVHRSAEPVSFAWTHLETSSSKGSAAAFANAPLLEYPPSYCAITFAGVQAVDAKALHRRADMDGTRYGKSEAWKGMRRVYTASKSLQQMLGYHGTEPYAAPPKMVEGVEEALMQGVQQCIPSGDWVGDRDGWTTKDVRLKNVKGGGRMGVLPLENILEEKEDVDGGCCEAEYSGDGTDELSTSTDSADSRSDTSSDNNSSRDDCNGAGHTLQPGDVPTALFPSPRLEAKTPGVHTVWKEWINGSFTTLAALAEAALPVNVQGLHKVRPQIVIEPCSPRRDHISRKRTLSTSTQQQPGPPSRRVRGDSNTGLPVLPADAEASWERLFPGNTPGLLVTLLTWSFAMQSFSNRFPEPKPLPLLPEFPYRIQRPVFEPLLSVALYDTSVFPHKEVLFIGPGDVAEMTYREVDTFSIQDDGYHPARHVPTQQRAAAGEGRWCYILIKGHTLPENATAPHVMVAFPISAVTKKSLCLHNLLPDNHASPKAFSRPRETLKRTSSSGDIMNGRSKIKGMRHMLRAASSMELPRVHQNEIGVGGIKDGAQVLHRRILKMEKAGRLPLVEGYRVNMEMFREWLDAVGRGQGKVIMWKEKE